MPTARITGLDGDPLTAGTYSFLNAGVPGSVVVTDLPITTSLTIDPERLYASQTVGDITGIAALRNTANYSTSEGTIASVEIRVNDVAQANGFVLSENDVVKVAAITSVPTEREWTISGGVEYAVVFADGPGNTLTIDRNDIVTSGIFSVDMTISDPPIDQTISLDVADLVAGAVMLAVPDPASDGTTISVDEGIAATEDAGGITGRNYRWLRFLTASETIVDALVIAGETAASYTIQGGDAGYTIVSEQTAIDAAGPGTLAVSVGGIEIANLSVVYALDVAANASEFTLVSDLTDPADVASDDYVFEFTTTHGEGVDNNWWLAVALQDASMGTTPYDDTSGVEQNAYNILMRKNGTLQIFRRTNGSATSVASTASSALSTGTVTDWRVTVTPSDITLDRLNGVGTVVSTVTTNNTVGRGGNISLGRFRMAGEFTNLVNTQTV